VDSVDRRKNNVPVQNATSPKESSPDDVAEFRVVDKRHFLGLDSQVQTGETVEVKPRYPTYVEELTAKVADTERRFNEKVRQVDQETARARARLEADYERQLALARQDMILPFLDVLDNLERALEAASAGGSKEDLIEGLRMTAGLFRARLRAHAVEPVEVLHRPFDPALSQAVGVVPVSEPDQDGLVLDVVLPGYRMENLLVRPAQVRVAQYTREPGREA
jgi:molecular chaperone GrpE